MKTGQKDYAKGGAQARALEDQGGALVRAFTKLGGASPVSLATGLAP